MFQDDIRWGMNQILSDPGPEPWRRGTSSRRWELWMASWSLGQQSQRKKARYSAFDALISDNGCFHAYLVSAAAAAMTGQSHQINTRHTCTHTHTHTTGGDRERCARHKQWTLPKKTKLLSWRTGSCARQNIAGLCIGRGPEAQLTRVWVENGLRDAA